MTSLHETFAALLHDVLPDADDVAFADLVDDAVARLEALVAAVL